MKKVLLSAMAAAFVTAVGTVSFMPVAAFAEDKPKVDCTKKENVDKPECKVEKK
jgi:hypothetical protein